jgi:hypothetical protein
MVCSVDVTAGSITQTSASGFSVTSANPWVMKPQKYDAAKVTRNDVNAMPNSSPASLARSATSMRSAMRHITAGRTKSRRAPPR